jgi:hypothetical protein
VLALVLAALLVWYFAFRSEDEEQPSGPGSIFATATSLDFGDETVASRSASETVRLINTGEGPLALGPIELAGDNPGAFTITEDTDCAAGETLVPQASCSIVLQFTPPDVGERSALVTVEHSGGGSPLEITLRGEGTGRALPVVSTTRVEFGEVALGRRANPQEITVTNGGSIPLAIQQLLIRGDNPGDFPLTEATTCDDEATLAPGQSCVVALSFRPAAPGLHTATLVVGQDATDEPITVILRGTGRGQPRSAIEPSELDLGAADVGSAGAAGSVTLANRGTAPLTIDAIVFSGLHAADYSLGDETTCSTEEPLPEGESCSIQIGFSPTAAGPRFATLLVVHDAPARVSMLQLTGEGVTLEPPPEEPPVTEPPATTETAATTG